MLQNFFEKSRFLVIIVIINCIISSIFLYLSTIYLLIDAITFIVKNIYATNFEVKIVVVKFLKILDVSLIAITFHLISAGFYKLFIQQAIFDNSSFLKTLSINKFHDLKLIILHVSIIVIVILFLEDIVFFGGTLANLYAGISSSLVILAIIFTCKLLDNDHHKDDE